MDDPKHARVMGDVARSYCIVGHDPASRLDGWHLGHEVLFRLYEGVAPGQTLRRRVRLLEYRDMSIWAPKGLVHFCRYVHASSLIPSTQGVNSWIRSLCIISVWFDNLWQAIVA